MNVVFMLWRRQLKRFWRSRARVVGALGQPLLYLIALGFGFGPVFQQAGRGSYLQFLAPGVIAMTILYASVYAGFELLWDRQFGFLKETIVAPVPRATIMVGRTLGSATVALIQGLIVAVVCLATGFQVASLAGAATSIVFMMAVAILFTALGTALASLMTDFQGFQFVTSFLIMPIFFLSGALFPLDGLPTFLGVVARLNPLSYGVDGLRGTLTGAAYFGMPFDLAVLASISGAALLAASYLFARIEL